MTPTERAALRELHTPYALPILTEAELEAWRCRLCNDCPHPCIILRLLDALDAAKAERDKANRAAQKWRVALKNEVGPWADLQEREELNAEFARLYSERDAARAEQDIIRQSLLQRANNCAVWITGNPYEDKITDELTAWKAIDEAHRLGQERNNEANQLRAELEQTRGQVAAFQARPVIPVVAAVIRAVDGRYLIARRRPEQWMGNRWCFAGGKVEAGETLEAAVEREIREELGVQIEVGAMIHQATERYEHGTFELHYFSCRLPRGQHPKRLQVADWLFATPTELLEYDLLPVDVDIARLLVAADMAAHDQRITTEARKEFAARIAELEGQVAALREAGHIYLDHECNWDCSRKGNDYNCEVATEFETRLENVADTATQRDTSIAEQARAEQLEADCKAMCRGCQFDWPLTEHGHKVPYGAGDHTKSEVCMAQPLLRRRGAA